MSILTLELVDTASDSPETPYQDIPVHWKHHTETDPEYREQIG